jgi:hypothetical protein
MACGIPDTMVSAEIWTSAFLASGISCSVPKVNAPAFTCVWDAVRVTAHLIQVIRVPGTTRAPQAPGQLRAMPVAFAVTCQDQAFTQGDE